MFSLFSLISQWDQVDVCSLCSPRYLDGIKLMSVLIVLLDISMGSSCCKEGEDGEWDEVAEEEASSW